MLRITTFNANGIRSATNKGFFDWLRSRDIDILCLQETKAQEHQLHAQNRLPAYHTFYFDAEKKGYSGVAIYSRHEPKRIVKGLGWSDCDKEGRYIQIDFEKLSVASLYMPSGSSSAERQEIKFRFLDRFIAILEQFRRRRRNFIICGDWNIAHRKIDIKNWRGNQKNSGFLPEERAWMDKVLDGLHYVDAFRAVNSEPDQYTWWSNRGQARQKNVGWRIDYQIITPGLKDSIRNVDIYTEQRFSDHAPLTIDYDIVP